MFPNQSDIFPLFLVHDACLRSYFKNSWLVFHRGFQTLENNKSTRPTASCFHQFSRVWKPRWNTRTRFWNITSITRMTEEILETFPRVFCFPKSRINENGGNGNFEETSRGRSLSYLFNSCSKKREAVYFWKIMDWVLRDYNIRTKRECEKPLS